LRIECQPQKCEIAGGEIEGDGWSDAGKFFKENGDDQRARVVIGGVTFRIIRNDEDGVLDDSRVVRHAMQVIEFYRGKASRTFSVFWAEKVARGLRKRSL